MSDKSPSKWDLRFWSIGAVFFGIAFVYGFVRKGFDLFEFAIFVFFAAYAVEMWKRRRKG